MLVLSSLRKLLAQVLSPPNVHTAVIFTATGELISFASSSDNGSKDEVRVLVGLGTEVWSETREDGEGMVDCELGRVIVHPISSSDGAAQQSSDPLLLIAICANDSVEWGKLQLKAKALSKHLSTPFGELRAKLAVAPAQSASKGSRTSR